MRAKKQKYGSEAGISMVELLMVCVIISVVGALALMQFGGSQAGLSRQNVAQKFKQVLERGRFDAVKRRVVSINRAKVIVDTNTMSLVTDVNNNGVTTDAADTVTTAFSGNNINITGGSTMTLPVTVYFDKRGEVEARDASNNLVNPVFLVCNGSCTISNNNSGNANILVVTPTGTVNLLPGGSSIPTFAAPAISTIPTGTGVKTDVVLP